MKNGKLFLALLLCLVLVLSCSACSAIETVKDALPFGKSESQSQPSSSFPAVLPTARPKVTPRPKATEKPWSLPENTPDPDGSFYFITRDDGTAFLVEYEGPDGDLVIPDEFEGCSVTSIYEEAFYGNEGILSVVVPDTVEFVEQRVFSGCKNLKTVKLSKNLFLIADETFMDTALTEIAIPDRVTMIGDSAFENCKNLKEVSIPKNAVSIRPRAFAGCESLTKATIPPEVTDIGTDAFAGCKNLTIYGYTGSEAERHANANKIPFVSIGGSPTPKPTAKPTAKPTEKPAVEVDLSAGIIRRTVTLYGDWGNSITLNPDGTFCLYVNLYEGYGSVYGTYEIMSTAYEFTVYDRDFYGFIGDDVWKFWMTPDGNTLYYSGEQIGMVEAGWFFQ